MARKRGCDDLGLTSNNASPAKRSRTTPPRHVLSHADERHGETDTAAGSSSSATDTISSSLSTSSDQFSGEEDEYDSVEDTSPYGTSSSSSSSSSESGGVESELEEDMQATDAEFGHGSDNEEPITLVPGRVRLRTQRMQNSSLLSRLSSFVPQLRAANQDLSRDIASGKAQDVIMDDAQDEGQYIEMNLGLGVLEEKDGDSDSDSDSDSESSSEASQSTAHGEDRDLSAAQSQNPRETRVLDRLMGNRIGPDKKRPGIEEIDD